jgi:hypothetical protein
VVPAGHVNVVHVEQQRAVRLLGEARDEFFLRHRGCREGEIGRWVLEHQRPLEVVLDDPDPRHHVPEALLRVRHGVQVVAIQSGDAGPADVIAEPLRLHARRQRLQLVEKAEVDRVGAADRERHAVHDDRIALRDLVKEVQRPPFRVDEVLRNDLEPVHFRPFRRDVPEMLRAQADPQTEVRESPSIRPGGRTAHVS